jgi:hypothetical protein
VTLLNAQANAAAITGTGAAATVYTYTLPANTVANLKGIRVITGYNHSTGTASVTYTLSLNGATLLTFSLSIAGGEIIEATVLNTGTTTGTVLGKLFVTSQTNTDFVATVTGLAWTSSQILTLTFNVAATDQVTPIQWIVETVQ